MEPTNIDVAAFHEAFADLAALFLHFLHKEVLLDRLQKTGGRLFDSELRAEAARGAGGPAIQAQLSASNPLIALACSSEMRPAREADCVALLGPSRIRGIPIEKPGRTRGAFRFNSFVDPSSTADFASCEGSSNSP